MDYYLNRINVILIVLVGGLCLFQWKGEKKADAQIVELHHTIRTDEDRVASQIQAIRAANEDIDEFKKIIAGLKTRADAGDVEIRGQKARIFALAEAVKQHDREAEIWKRTLATYKEAVAARDKNIQALFDQRRQLVDANKADAQKATDAVVAYNGLAAKYEDLVSKYNELAVRYQAEHTPAPKPSS
jgi:chromosome segregation ATPase